MQGGVFELNDDRRDNSRCGRKTNHGCRAIVTVSSSETEIRPLAYLPPPDIPKVAAVSLRMVSGSPTTPAAQLEVPNEHPLDLLNGIGSIFGTSGTRSATSVGNRATLSASSSHGDRLQTPLNNQVEQ